MAKFCTQTRTDHLQNIYWVLCLKVSLLPKNDVFKKHLHVGQQLRSGDGAVGWQAGCLHDRYSDLASVSLSNWP